MYQPIDRYDFILWALFTKGVAIFTTEDVLGLLPQESLRTLQRMLNHLCKVGILSEQSKGSFRLSSEMMDKFKEAQTHHKPFGDIKSHWGTILEKYSDGIVKKNGVYFLRQEVRPWMAIFCKDCPISWTIEAKPFLLGVDEETRVWGWGFDAEGRAEMRFGKKVSENYLGIMSHFTWGKCRKCKEQKRRTDFHPQGYVSNSFGDSDVLWYCKSCTGNTVDYFPNEFGELANRLKRILLSNSINELQDLQEDIREFCV